MTASDHDQPDQSIAEKQKILAERLNSNSHWEKKIWGWAWHVFASDQAAVSFLTTEEKFMCSIHRHTHRANFFAVVTGKVLIEEFRAGEVTEIVLGPGEVHTVPSGISHRFRVLESGMLIEVYWIDAKVDLLDIERSTVGGIDVDNS